MIYKRIICLLAAIACVFCVCAPAMALSVDCDTTYCFSAGDFAPESKELMGICITSLPTPETGTAMLGSRVLKSGDILPAELVESMTFVPLKTETDQSAVMTYLPIYEDQVAPSATMTIAIRGKRDQAPVAEDSALETYRNLPNEGKLKVSDPEGQAMTYTVTRQPKRGILEVREDGTFAYTPKKNKVGVDSFTYTATDPAGNVSREATVTVNILKPVDKTQYTDTAGESCRFAAEWMKNTGIFVGEHVDGQSCFQPDKAVTRGEFLAMLTKTLELPVDQEATFTGYEEDFPLWLKPYLAAAMRSGLTAGWPDAETFGANEPITGSEAAVMLQNAMDLSVAASDDAEDEVDGEVPVWAAGALTVMAHYGMEMAAQEPLTRAQAAQILYQANLLAGNAPGLREYQ